MREHLYKAKRLDNGEWVEGSCVNVSNIHFYIFTGKLDISNGYLDFEKYSVNPETICQFTGLTDKYGNKIWENDIVSDGSENRTYKFMYDEENLCLAADNKAFNKPIALITLVKYFSLTVIGSAIDNPELLKGGK